MLLHTNEYDDELSSNEIKQDYVCDELKDENNDIKEFHVSALENIDNTTLRELHAAIINATQEPIAYLQNNDPRVKTSKGNKARKYLMKIDLEN